MTAHPTATRTARTWLVALDESLVDADILSVDEQVRFRRFRHARDAVRFAACRTVLRRILGACCAAPPAHISFETTQAGRPLLSGRNGPHFSVARSGGYALIAVAEDDIGADIESQASLDAAVDVGGWLDRVGAGPAPSTLQRWVRAEAVAKAIGTGLPGLEAGALRMAHRFKVYDLGLGPSLAGAIALPGGDWRVALTTWQGAMA
jgi:4'-phosphopantetheinyl transferase